MRLGRVASVASPRLARTVVRRPPRSRGRRCRNQSRRRGRGRPRRVPAVCTIYKIRNNHVYIRSKTPMYCIISRSRGAGRATGVARLYIKYESITYTSHPKTPIYRSRTRPPRSPFATIAIARRRRVADGSRGVGAFYTPRDARTERDRAAETGSASFERTRSRARTARARRRAFRAPRARR